LRAALSQKCSTAIDGSEAIAVILQLPASNHDCFGTKRSRSKNQNKLLNQQLKQI
jgi:hypothetical protein